MLMAMVTWEIGVISNDGNIYVLSKNGTLLIGLAGIGRKAKHDRAPDRIFIMML